MDKKNYGVLLVAVSALGFGGMAVFAKIAYADGVNTFTMLAGRFTLASLIIWTIIFITGQKAAIGPDGFKSLAILSLLGYGGGSTFYFLSVKLLPASLASMLFYSYPVLVALGERFILREKLSKPMVFALFLSSMGLLLILGVTVRGISLSGLLYGLAAAVAYSGYLIYGRKVTAERPPLVTTGYLLLFASTGFIAYSLLSASFNFNFGPAGWWSIAGLAVFSTALAILALFSGMRWIKASRTAVISTFEPFFTVIFASLLLSERLLPLQMFGGIMLLAAVILLQNFSSEKAAGQSGADE